MKLRQEWGTHFLAEFGEDEETWRFVVSHPCGKKQIRRKDGALKVLLRVEGKTLLRPSDISARLGPGAFHRAAE
jgi:hypothetical protein